MLVVYLSLLFVLALVHFAVRRRAARLERQYTRVAGEADALLKKSACRAGNGNRPDPLVSARQQYDLARLAVKRDRVEARYNAWQARGERLAALRRRLTGYKGRLLPYLVGVTDVAGVVVVLQRLGVTPEQVRALVGM